MQLYAAGKLCFEFWKEVGCDFVVNNNTLNCIANTWALDFCVLCNCAGHFQICKLINIKMANAASGFNYRNSGILHNILNKFFTAAWQTYINHTNRVQNLVYVAVVMVANFNKFNCFRHAAFNPGKRLADYTDNFHIRFIRR